MIKIYFLLGMMLTGMGLVAKSQIWEGGQLARNLEKLRMMEAELEDMRRAYGEMEIHYGRLISLSREERQQREMQEREAFQVDAALLEDPLVKAIGERIGELQGILSQDIRGLAGLSEKEVLEIQQEQQRMAEVLAREEEWWRLFLAPGVLRMEEISRWEQVLRLGERVKTLEEYCRQHRAHWIWVSEVRIQDRKARNRSQNFYYGR